MNNQKSDSIQIARQFLDSLVIEGRIIGSEHPTSKVTVRRSRAYYSGIDFGEYGSDTITMSVFALSDAPYPIEIWNGIPGEEGSRLVDTVIYQKPSRWNVYQEETWKLSERFHSVSTIGFLLQDKVHIKGFVFLCEKKAFRRLAAAECDRIYGDSFVLDGEAVRGIGNNVTLVYEGMDFGEKGAKCLTLWGNTDLEKNTIHVHFTTEDGDAVSCIVEYPNGADTMNFFIEGFCGKGRVEFIFLPGSSFDLRAVQFGWEV